MINKFKQDKNAVLRCVVVMNIKSLVSKGINDQLSFVVKDGVQRLDFFPIQRQFSLELDKEYDKR
jgi:hypothetical protein